MVTKTLLRVPDLITVIEPLVDVKLAVDDFFRLIGDGAIKPLGFVQRMPVFGLDQVAEVVKAIQGAKK